MQGAFVRALGAVYHLQCFKCMDCGTVVASKFFPIDGQDGKQHPLCERDYFGRLNLICAKCGTALRGSYITACNKKFHVEHFTCSVCPTLFGPQDSYYEHEGDVYCHFHYSTRYATKCAGCNSAILKQFVEINRNMRDECWHPECYMINKFWNVKVSSRRPLSIPQPGAEDADGNAVESPYIEEERRETASTLRDKQIRMEQQVYRIWTVLSAFEESSAACISDMLRQVSNGQYLEAIRMAEKFILHVEVLFATIDDLEYHFARLKLKGMSHVREARMLCRKTVDLFTLLSHTQETGARRMGMTQELFDRGTEVGTGAGRSRGNHFFSGQVAYAGDPGRQSECEADDEAREREIMTQSDTGNLGTQGVTYGFKSLAPENAGESPFSAAPRDPSLAKVNVVNPPSDLCVKCNQTVEEDCVRLAAAVPVAKEPPPPKSPEDKDKDKEAPKLSTARRPPANVGLFVFGVDSMKDTASFGTVPTVILCTEHAHGGCRGGFQTVSRLEQYAFLLNVALRRLYVLLKKRGVVPASPAQGQISQREFEDDPYRNSTEINRLKSVHLDRKLSSTARVPKRSTIVESPAGKVAQATDVAHSQRAHEFVSPQHNRSAPQLGQPSSARIHKGPHQAHVHSLRPQPASPGAIDTSVQSQINRPSFNRANTEVKIVDDSAPNSPSGGIEEAMVGGVEDGITLADIPQIFEAAQAREQRRSLPRQSSIPFIAELTPLELAIVRHSAVLVLQRSPLRDQFDLDEILELVEIKKSSFWNKLFKPGNDKKNVKKKGVFGVPLELLVEREGADSLLGASRATLKIPSFVDDVVSAMRQMDMSIEGIFRRNGNIRRLKELTEAIDRDPSDTLEVLFVFLKWVASFAHMDEETGSKMDLPNLATVICPSVLYSRGRDAVRDESFGAIRVVTSLLENQDEFYCVPEEFLSILHDQEYFANSMELPSKEFLKKCDAYMRFKAGGRTPGLTSPILGSAPFNLNPGTPKPEDMRAMPPRTAHSNPQFLERPQMGAPSSSDGMLRNGHPQSRQQQQQPPPNLQHPSFSYPPPGAPPPSSSQGSTTAIHSPQPRAPNMQSPSSEWAPLETTASYAGGWSPYFATNILREPTTEHREPHDDTLSTVGVDFHSTLHSSFSGTFDFTYLYFTILLHLTYSTDEHLYP
ncbi:Rho-type GTPase-activating protein 1 [Grifola frondosa]|uniref:Rho-type GTPase-activating protein 1 n=1 Tax=Grifola frondosa TaxID=5627 RepID=A0A1C7MG78_GRIFR|nr:Rho-type GTPase-activating protein 1 [Grifola frondosa]